MRRPLKHCNEKSPGWARVGVDRRKPWLTAFVLGDTRGVPAGDVAEGHRRAEIDAAGGVVAAHDARHVGPGRIQPRDRRAVCVQHAGAGIGLQSGEGAEAAGDHLDGVERPAFDRRDAGVGLVVGVASERL